MTDDPMGTTDVEQAPAPGFWLGADGRWYPPQAVGVAPPTNGMATASMVLGIIGLCLFWALGLGGLLGLLAVIFGGVGMSRSSTLPGQYLRGRAKAGLAMGIIAMVASGIFFVATIAAVDDAVEDLEIDSDPPNGVCDMDRFMQDPDC